MARRFNEYFGSVFVESNITADSSTGGTDSLRSMPDITITEQGVFSLLLNIDSKKSPGPDNIPNEFLKRYAECISKYLTIIFRVSLEQHSVPRDWLCARVVPVHKSGDKHNVTNYRPISLTCTSCKLFEHIISRSLYDCFESSNIFL